jgi:hypothetical protein
MPLPTADCSPAYNTQFLGYTSEAILEQYCAWLSDPWKPRKRTPPSVAHSSHPLVNDEDTDDEGTGSSAFRFNVRSYATKAPLSLVDPALGPSEQDVLCLFMRELDYDVFHGPVTHVYVTHLARHERPLPYGVKIVRENGKWSADPELLDPSFFPFLKSVRMKADWALSLINVNRSVLSPLFRFEKMTGLSAHHEAQVLINHFRRVGLHAFFENTYQAFAWKCALEWSDWEIGAVDKESRIAAISSAIGAECSEDVFEKIIPPALASTRTTILSDGPPFTSGTRTALQMSISPVLDEDQKAVKKSEPANLPLKIQLAEEEALFSTGGPYSLRFPSTMVSVAGGPPHDLWWWKGYVDHTWSDEEINLFSDNWSRSAFAYELFARKSFPLQWFVFKRPWHKLTFSMRALLQVALDIDVPGRDTLRAHLAQRLDADDPDLMLFIADLRLSKAKLLADFEAKLGAANLQKEARSRHSEFPKPLWKILEVLDESRLRRKRMTLDDSQRSELSKARTAVNKAWRRMLLRLGKPDVNDSND